MRLLEWNTVPGEIPNLGEFFPTLNLNPFRPIPEIKSKITIKTEGTPQPHFSVFTWSFAAPSSATTIFSTVSTNVVGPQA